MENLKEKAKVFLTKAGRILIVIAAVFIGYVGANVHATYKSKLVKSPVPVVKTLSETSIALNERNEMLIINRADGTYQIYQDSVGITIFNLYAEKMYFSKQNVASVPVEKKATINTNK